MEGEPAHAHPGMPQDAGDGAHTLQIHHEASMLQAEPLLPVDLTQLPVEALLSALNHKPEAELREASGRLTVLTELGAKVGAKVVALRQPTLRPQENH